MKNFRGFLACLTLAAITSIAAFISLTVPMSLAAQPRTIPTSPSQTPIAAVPDEAICDQIPGTLGYQSKTHIKFSTLRGDRDLFLCGHAIPDTSPQKFTESTVLVRDPKKSRLHCLVQIASYEVVAIKDAATTNPVLQVVGIEDYNLTFDDTGGQIETLKTVTTEAGSISDDALERIRLHGSVQANSLAEEEQRLFGEIKTENKSDQLVALSTEQISLKKRVHEFTSELGVAARNGSAAALQILGTRIDARRPSSAAILEDDSYFQLQRAHAFLAEKQRLSEGGLSRQPLPRDVCYGTLERHQLPVSKK